MAFKAASVIPESAYKQIKTLSVQIDNLAIKAQSALVADVTADEIINLVYRLQEKIDNITALATTHGLLQYAKDQENDQAYDVVAEYTAMVAAVNDVVAWAKTNFPADGDDYILAYKWGANTHIERTFSPAATVGLSTELQKIIDVIE